MSIKSRLNKLEKKQSSDNTSFALIFCNAGETSDEAKQRWKTDNPGVTPAHIMVVQFVKADGTYI